MNEPENPTPSFGNGLILVVVVLMVGVLVAYANRDWLVKSPAGSVVVSKLQQVSAAQTTSTAPVWQETTDPTPAFAKVKQFESDIVTHDNQGHNLKAHVYADGGKIRSNMTINGMATYSIMRKDLQKIFQVVPEQGIYVALPLNNQINQAFDPDRTGTGEWNREGNDITMNVACTRFRVTYPGGKTDHVWIETATKSPVYIAADDGSYQVEWSHFKAGPQDPVLFELPANYQKIELNMALPNLPGMPSTPSTSPNSDRPAFPILPSS